MKPPQYRILAKYKYVLIEPYLIATQIQHFIIDSKYIFLDRFGVLEIKAGYAWDGASGPAIDTVSIIRASLVHDALYQLIRLKLLDGKKYRKAADKLFRRICREDGMGKLRTWYAYLTVRLFGGWYI